MQQTLENVALNREQFFRFVAALAAFVRLERAIGVARADEVANLLYRRQLRETDPDGRYILVPGGDLEQYVATMGAVLQAECDQFAAKRAYAAELLEAALAGRLRGRLDGADGWTAASRLPPFAREAAIEGACDWICRTLHGERRETVRTLLAQHADGANGTVLGRTPELLDGIHARIFPEAPAYRSPNPEVSYPSSVGGRHLLETVFEWTARAEWPLPGDGRWLDVALFYLGAVGTVQGYADGNKRIARMAYAITLLRGRHPFVAPGDAVEVDLIRMIPPRASPAV